MPRQLFLCHCWLDVMLPLVRGGGGWVLLIKDLIWMPWCGDILLYLIRPHNRSFTTTALCRQQSSPPPSLPVLIRRPALREVRPWRSAQ